jgi:TRAP-type C4-dicarboxylate transport system substrate-binding protein
MNAGRQRRHTGYDQLVSALQSGVVDGAENNEPSYETGQHYRYAKYYSRTGHLMIPELLVFSKRTWTGLSPEDRADHQPPRGAAGAAQAGEMEQHRWPR